MVTALAIIDILHLCPIECINLIKHRLNETFENVKTEDLLNPVEFKNSICDQNYHALFKRGVYVFAFPNKELAYIGKVDQGFYLRLRTHMITAISSGKPADSVLQRIFRSKSGGVSASETAQLEEAKVELKGMPFLIINTDELPKTCIARLERKLLQAAQGSPRLLNSVHGKKTINLEKPLLDLIVDKNSELYAKLSAMPRPTP